MQNFRPSGENVDIFAGSAQWVENFSQRKPPIFNAHQRSHEMFMMIILNFKEFSRGNKFC